MKEKWELAGDYSVEIWFRIEKNQRGYPTSKEWEQLLARPGWPLKSNMGILSPWMFLRL